MNGLALRPIRVDYFSACPIVGERFVNRNKHVFKSPSREISREDCSAS